MQDKLMRSSQDRMIAGVCGGVGAYFDIDSTIVRLVMVLLAFTGTSIVIYPLLWLVMPKAPFRAAPGAPPASIGNEWGSQQPGGFVPPLAGEPEPLPMRFDPYTGQPLTPPSFGSAVDASRPIPGATVRLQQESFPDPTLPPFGAAAPPPTYAPPTVVPVNHRARRPKLGLILVGIGLLALAQQLNIAFDFLFPMALIGLGIFLLARRGR
ncbi:MAG TPA: PspC domain-containing protein [Herpetosiphonaceae bacterium]